MSERWGQSVIVDNRGSAGGLVGFELGAKAMPDGYTLLLAIALAKAKPGQLNFAATGTNNLLAAEQFN